MHGEFIIVILLLVKLRSCERNLEGGRYADYREFLYVVSLQDKMTREHRCTGVLVTLKHVMTAGQCLARYDPKLGTFTRDHRTSIVYGLSRFTNDLEPGIYRYIYKWIIHPNLEFVYDSYWTNDVGIVLLEEPYSEDTVTPINIYSNVKNKSLSSDLKTLNHTKDKTDCVVVGWSWNRFSWLPEHDENSLNPDQLKVISVTLTEDNVCASRIRGIKATYSFANLSMLQASCADALSQDKNTCFGEPGSPIICKNKLWGISSWWVGCGKQYGPLVYANKNPILDFYQVYGFDLTSDAPITRLSLSLILYSIYHTQNLNILFGI